MSVSRSLGFGWDRAGWAAGEAEGIAGLGLGSHVGFVLVYGSRAGEPAMHRNRAILGHDLTSH
jgi:hypothetical protein